jgi:uncharacterized membrane protein YidH (DUF202 family)
MPIFPPSRHPGYNRGMAIALTVFGVAFAAFCVWLTVRIGNRKERWAKRTLAAALGVPLLYVASLAPLFWLDAQVHIDSNSPVADACRIYAIPAKIVYEDGPQQFRDALDWYRDLFR